MNLDAHKKNKHVTQFEMSAKTKNLWLATRKKNVNIGVANISGLFQTEMASPLDVFFFWLVIVCELAGFGVLIWLGLANATGIIVVGMFIVIDVVCAWLAHKLEANKCRIERYQLIEDEPALVNRKRSELITFTGKFLRSLGFIGILAIALGKAYGFWFFYGTIDIVAVFVFVMYALIAYGHINHTWFVVTALWVRKNLNSDYNNFNKTFAKNPTTTANYIGDSREVIIDCVKKELVEMQVDNRHKLEFRQEITDVNGQVIKYRYALVTNGILTDEELYSFAIKQPKEWRALIVNKGMEHQYEDMLDSNAMAYNSQKQLKNNPNAKQ